MADRDSETRVTTDPGTAKNWAEKDELVLAVEKR